MRPSLRSQKIVPLTGVLAALFVIALIFLVGWQDRRELFLTAERTAENTAALLEEHTRGLFDQSVFLVQEVASVATAGAGDPVLAHERLKSLVRAGPHIHSAFVTDASGRVVLSSIEHPARPMDVSNARIFQILRDRADAGFAVGRHPFSAFAGEPAIGIIGPVGEGDGFRGVAAVLMSTDYYRRFFERVDVGFPLSIALVRGDGRVLVREPSLKGSVDFVPPVAGTEGHPAQAVARGRSPLDGRERIFAVNRVGEQDVWVVVGLDVAAVEARWHGQLVAYLAFLGSAMVGIGVLTALAMIWAGRERKARAGLETANRTLETRVAERTAALVETNARLSSTLKEKDVLFREVHHRVKNNLQVIASLLRLQAMRMEPDVRKSFEDMLNRIYSMGLVHELLYRSNQPADVDFGEYLRALATSVVESTLDQPDRVRVEVTADPLALDLEMAIPLGLLVNELLSNALKHAFPGGRAGHLWVVLRNRPDEGLCIQVTDDGVGLSGMQQKSAGIGLLLVRSLAAQVGAEVESGPRDGGGSCWTVNLPQRQSHAA